MKIDHFLNFKRDVIRENIVVFELLKGKITHENRLVSEKKKKEGRSPMKIRPIFELQKGHVTHENRLVYEKRQVAHKNRPVFYLKKGRSPVKIDHFLKRGGLPVKYTNFLILEKTGRS